MDARAPMDFEPIAIIGSGCRFAKGATTPEAFWQLLRTGTDFIGPVPTQRWDSEAIYDESAAQTGTTYCKVGAFLQHVDRFDAHYFGISASEAREMDPQQRLLLEVACEGVARAGMTREQLKGSRTAVYVGMLGMDYLALHSREAGVGQIDPYYAAGKEFSFAAGRIAYHLGVHGPAMTVTTACSSSLVAMHLACRALQAGEADLALAGGVNLMLAPDLTIYMSQIRAISPSGRCRVFDAAADGIVRGEGCGVVVLKRLADAMRDGDPIQAVIRGSAINQDGASAGQTVPNANAQAAVIAEALQVAGLSVDDIDYIEAHGTGTPLGDPIELSSLARVFQGRERSLMVGSVKANMGHLDAAAGMASVLKTMKVLEHAEVPPQLHLTRLNELVDWKRSMLCIPTTLEALPKRSLLAGVSGFGLSGTNVHMILEDASAYRQARSQQVPAARPRPWILPVSAKSAQGVPDQARAYAGQLPEQDDRQLQAFVASALHRREHFAFRRAVVGVDGAQLKNQLAQLTVPCAACATDEESEPAAVFVFTGQGAQWVGMGRDLLEREPVFLSMIQRCDQAMAQWAHWSIEAELRSAQSASRLHLTEFAQPCIFAIQVALAECLGQWGVRPAAVVGHSMGEVAAAYCAGALDLESAVRVIHFRAQAMKGTLGRGRMLVVGLAAQPLQARLAEDRQLELSVVNSRTSCVVSGSPEAVLELDRQLREEGVFTYLMPAEYAFHSYQMDACLEAIRSGLDGLEAVPASIPWVSTSAMPDVMALADAQYWLDNARGTVRFDRAIEHLVDQGHRLFVELGPHMVLAASINQALADRGVEGLVCGALHKQGDAATELATILARLYEQGVKLDWQAYQPKEQAIDLPAYPWQHERFWFTPAPVAPLVEPLADLRAQVVVYDAQGNIRAQARDVPLSQPGQPEPALQVAMPVAVREPARTALAIDVPGQIKALLSEIIGAACVDPDPDRGFFELGLDSISLVEFKRKLEQRLGLKLSATVGFDHPTLNRLSHYLQGLLSSQAQATPAGTEGEPGNSAASDCPAQIAVVAMACRFPQADSPEALWQLLLEQTPTVVPVPQQRLIGAAASDGFPRFASLIECPEGFDEDFFRISPKEARSMDPQQRLLLMVAWEALERAGLSQEKLLDQRVGVFVGANSHDYEARVLNCPEGVDANYGTGSSFSAMCGRLSHFLGVRGPSLTVDTACSSSLAAIHLACNSLRSAECDVAIVGGVNVIASASIFQSMGQAGALAADGISKTFDDRADGYGRGEGCGVVILKRQANAEQDRDPIVATILGSAINHDGACAGLTVPNGPAQEALVRDALARSGVRAEQVGYVEAHGTGTVLGDPIELNALHNAYRQGCAEGTPALTVASVKANIGHLEAAAGIASLIKACLVAQRGLVPPQPHLHTANTRVAWEQMNLKLPRQAVAWPEPAEARIAGVSAFGFTGTNVHVLLKGHRPLPVAPLSDGAEPVALCLSAATPAALSALAGRYLAFLAETGHAAQEICSNALVRRTWFKERLVVHGRNCQELREALQAWLEGSSAIGDKVSCDEPWALLADAFMRGDRSSCPERLPEGHRALELPGYPWQLNDYWIETVAPALSGPSSRALPAHPCLHSLARPTGDIWYWSAVLDPQGDYYEPLAGRGQGLKPYWLLDALLQAIRETPRGPQQIRDLRIARVGLATGQPLISHLTLHLQACGATFELAVQGVHDEIRHVCMSGTLQDCEMHLPGELQVPGEQPLELSEEGLPGLSASSAAGPRQALSHFAASLAPEQRQADLLENAIKLFEGAHAAALLGFARVQVLADLPSSLRVVLAPGADGQAGCLQAFDLQGCRVALFEAPLLAEPGSRYLAEIAEAAPEVPMIRREWRDYPLPEASEPAPGHWLVLACQAEDARPLEAACQAGHCPVEVIALQDDTQPLPQRLAQVLRRVGADAGCRGLVVLGTTGTGVGQGGLSPALLAGTDFMQALAAATASSAKPAKPIWFAVAGSQASEPVAAVIHAAWQGAAHIFAMEHPAWWGGLVSLDGRDSRSYASLCQLLRGQPSHDHLAIEGVRVRAQYLVEEPAAGVWPLDLPPLAGTVLIHACPGSDLEPVLLALARRGAQRALLLSQAPDQVRRPQPTPLPLSTVMLAQEGDLALAQLLGSLRAQGPIAGFVHLGTDWRTVALAQPEFGSQARALARQLEVLQQIHQALDDPRAFFLIIGSVTSLLGGAGFAACAIADAYATWIHDQRRRQGLACQLLQVTQSERELEHDANARAALQASGLQPLSQVRIEQGILRLLEGGHGPRGLLDVQWPQLKRLYQSILPWPLLEHVGMQDIEQGPRLDAFAGMPPARQRRAMQALVCEMVGQVLGITDGRDLDVRKGFFDMGMSSVMSLDLRARLNRALGIDLPSTFGFEYTCIEQVTNYLVDQLLEPAPVVAAEPGAQAAQQQDLNQLSRAELIGALEDELRELANY
ncbi:acyltransferase domain-containing protein [Pseudomonas sp. MSSRFD41]|uniref:type I polyketide synthase n=1 Tax=Pseudomonas sp. MSSRFD41 TaxID=1310370 RepID=UPI001639CD06|nr:type I polyketide synthase [Pseudomonas sp. MSSRFD41]MBC2656216.1 acyltransferase domain-containing protein [Pseudomonas sp. MSSRFD41]